MNMCSMKLWTLDFNQLNFGYINPSYSVYENEQKP